MPEPSVDWRYIFDEPIEVNGSGGTLSATATFEVNWTDREAFVNQALGLPTASSGWPLPQVPWDCPFQPNSGLLAASFRFKPHSLRSSISGADNTVSGHFEKAWVTIGFERPKYDFDVPTPQNQIDPLNPILFCEMSIETRGTSLVVPGYSLEYISGPADAVPTEPFVAFIDEADYVLNFPFVPYIPWNYLEPYHEKVNDRTLFGRKPGTIKFNGASLRQETFVDGTNRTSCTLRLSYRSVGWNSMRCPDDGNYYEVRDIWTGKKMFPEANLAAIWS
jgi:hypothetical protein